MNIGFIGFGSMAKAIAKGLKNQNKYQLFASSPSLTTGINQDGIHTFCDNNELIKQVNLIILAVKPAQMDKVIQEISRELSNSCLLISVAAGLTIEWFNQRLSKPQAIIRAMPNTPASIGLAATPLFANSLVDLNQKHLAETLFSSIGITQWINEEQEMNLYTALSGSGPAYVYSFIESLIKGANALGLDTDTARLFALQTCKGALKLAETSNLEISDLKNQVISPGGTTAAALNKLDPMLEKLVYSALEAAQKRAEELGALYTTT